MLFIVGKLASNLGNAIMQRKDARMGPFPGDDRTPLQWYRSIKTYLEWRAGLCWRPVSDRFHPIRLEYLRALDTLRAAFEHDERATVAAELAPAPERCPGWSPARRLAFERSRRAKLPPKKPAAGVQLAATKVRKA